MSSSEKVELMRYIQQVGFAVDDVVLYLDTHPHDADAIAYYEKYKKLSREASKEYTNQYGPLTNENVNTTNGWAWVKDPWPWEGEC